MEVYNSITSGVHLTILPSDAQGVRTPCGMQVVPPPPPIEA